MSVRSERSVVRAAVTASLMLVGAVWILGCQGDAPDAGAAADPPEWDAAADNLEWTDGGGSSSEQENLVYAPLELPPADYSGAVAETEPNDNAREATPLGPDLVARGTFEGRETDYYTFTSEGEPQLWAVEARGDSLEELRYQDVSKRRDLRSLAEGDSATLTNLYLPPGRHLVYVRGRSGPYTLRVVPLGPPDPWTETEPNDDESRAQILEVGRSRLGYLAEADDHDYYRFSLRTREHLSLLVAPPPGLPIRTEVRAGGDLVALLELEAGDTLRFAMALPPDDYHVRLRSDGRSTAQLPYRIRLDRLDPFDRPSDLEPNNSPLWAGPLPATLEARGEVGVRGDDEDWYRLPVQAEAARVTLRPTRLPEGRQLHQMASVRYHGGTRSLGLDRNPEDGSAAVTIPAGMEAYLRVAGRGPYGIQVELEPGPGPRPEPTPGDVELAFPAGPHLFAAFWPLAQRGELPLRLRNTATAARQVTLDLVTTDPAWRAASADSAIELGPGETRVVPIALTVDRDAWGEWPVRVTARAVDGAGRWRTASTELAARCDAPPVNPGHPEPLPPALLGGVNVAWAGLGARVASTDETRIRKESTLLDGFTPSDDHWYVSAADLPWDLDVDLAGDDTIRVAGVVLDPRAPRSPWEQVRDFELWLSTDGTRYDRVLAGALGVEVGSQAFVLPESVPARFARLRVLTDQGQRRSVYLTALKVVAEPGSTAWEARGVNLADPAVGGHVVWSDPPVRDPREPELLTEAEEGEVVRLDPLNPNEWVIGFHHDRAARIRRIEWVQASRTDRSFPDGAAVAVSTGSPLGPWTPLGRLAVEPRPGASAVLDLPAPVWARFVKLTATAVDTEDRVYTPETVRIFEQPVDGRHRSILGEWGQYERAAAFERLGTGGQGASAAEEASANDTRDQAQPLAAGQPQRGTVAVGEDVDWYRIRTGTADNRLRVEIRGIPSLRAELRLQDEAGTGVPLEPLDGESDPGVRTVYEARVAGGAAYYLEVSEPPRTIALVWDNSGSVTPFHETLYPSLLRFTADVMPGREFVNLLPFSLPRFLLEDWTDQPYALQAALVGYDRSDGSSNAELNLGHAVDRMRDRKGTKAVVLLTDANSPGFKRSPQLWDGLRAVRPSIFAVELHRGNVAHQQDLMQDWASVNAGTYDFFRTGADLDVAFRRASCMIRRPARYELQASTRHEEAPLPGFVAVDPGALQLNAVELILDASGSMLQRLEGRRRIEIARDVLSDLVANTIPEGTPLALRIFGHRTPDACETDLEVPVRPLDRDRVTAIIRRTEAMNLAKTPIGTSLALVAEDLQGVTGQKLIMLITDGEETCEGDPAQAVRDLKEAGHDVRVNIVGFAIDDEGLKSQFESWAREGGGLYFNAGSGEELAEAVDRALRPKFQVMGPAGDVLGEGTVGLDAVEAPVGEYTVRILSSPVRTIRAVRVGSEDTTVVSMESGGGEEAR